jgi:hypothetical protein
MFFDSIVQSSCERVHAYVIYSSINLTLFDGLWTKVQIAKALGGVFYHRFPVIAPVYTLVFNSIATTDAVFQVKVILPLLMLQE